MFGLIQSLFPLIIPIIIAILVIAFLASGYVKAPPDVAYIISGIKKEPGCSSAGLASRSRT